MFLIGGRTLGGEYIDSFGVALDTWMKQSNSRKYLPRHYHHRGPPSPLKNKTLETAELTIWVVG